MLPTRYLDSRQRVEHGKAREAQIADALATQHSLKLVAPTSAEDCQQKIDRWLYQGGKRTAVQIKYRETGDDLLVEVYKRFGGSWDSPLNKTGRDMIGDSLLYAVLRQDMKTVVMVPTSLLKVIVREMLEAVYNFGWTMDNGQFQTLRYSKAGGRCELKTQRDPGDGRTKMIAYIPVNVLTFEHSDQVKTYRVKLPANWQ